MIEQQQSDLPPDWALHQGAGGWYAKHATRSGWQTIVYCDSAKEGLGKPRAIAAAWAFVDMVGKVLAERERERAALRAYLETNEGEHRYAELKNRVDYEHV